MYIIVVVIHIPSFLEGIFILNITNKGICMKLAVISIILENTEDSQKEFNEAVSQHKHMIKGRMGIPMNEVSIAVISLVVVGELDEINSFNGKLGKIKNVTSKTVFAKKEI